MDCHNYSSSIADDPNDSGTPPQRADGIWNQEETGRRSTTSLIPANRPLGRRHAMGRRPIECLLLDSHRTTTTIINQPLQSLSGHLTGQTPIGWTEGRRKDNEPMVSKTSAAQHENGKGCRTDVLPNAVNARPATDRGWTQGV